MTRHVYQESLMKLESGIQSEGDLVAQSLREALDALHLQDAGMAEQVIAFDDRIDEAHLEIELFISNLLALQTPVAGDLRLVLAILHVNHYLERMGDQCVNIAKLTKLVGEVDLPDDVGKLLGEMGARAEVMVRTALDSFDERDTDKAVTLTELDELVDTGNREIVSLVIAHEGNDSQREAGIRATQIARCLERIGDNAVDIGEQTVFLVTGERREFEDASHPAS